MAGKEGNFTDTLQQARKEANAQILNPRDRAIIVRHIEDALCWARAAGSLSVLVPPVSNSPRG